MFRPWALRTLSLFHLVTCYFTEDQFIPHAILPPTIHFLSSALSCWWQNPEAIFWEECLPVPKILSQTHECIMSKDHQVYLSTDLNANIVCILNRSTLSTCGWVVWALQEYSGLKSLQIIHQQTDITLKYPILAPWTRSTPYIHNNQLSNKNIIASSFLDRHKYSQEIIISYI